MTDRLARPGALLGAALLAGCVSGNGPPTLSGRQVTYSCDRGPDITVIYSGDSARVETGAGQAVIIPKRESGSGFLYESPTHSLRGQGNEVTYTVGRMVPIQCKTG